MKKILLSVLCLALCFCMFSCDLSALEELEKDLSKIGEGETLEESKPAEELTFSLNETAAFSNLTFTATELKESTGTEYFKPEEGKVFVGVKFVIENTSDKEQSVSTILLFDGYAGDVKCDYSISAACVFDEGTLDGSVAPGKKLEGWYALEVPADWTSIELFVKSSFLSSGTAKFVFEK